ncbi:alpha/beta hydrolase [Paenibacillus sp. H1-7]|uniref:alpha/beta hydrolase n=1 Tax=Paenibacillus sp. H1-7 TaxID=2282849 RepID=UPI001EF9ADAB|nr:alpha/beta hydrolase [Paenibacillus sp. H1-7]ULL13100.1 alpha/beta hydrolase [Paenibacillus sp. H1-7]
MNVLTSRWIRGILSLIVVLLLADVIASFYFYHVAIKRSPKDFLADDPDLEQLADSNRSNWMNSQPLRQLSIQSHDGLTLSGYYIEAAAPTNKTAIIAHGYSGKAADMDAFAKFYHDGLGFNVLLPDARGHGKSEGDYIGFGWPERKDYLQWIQRMIEIVGPDAAIALHGVSMGGATVSMTSGEMLPGNVKAIVSDCAYTSAKDELSYQLMRLYHLPDFPILPSTSLLTKVRAGYFFGEASAIEQVRRTAMPMLFIHGKADAFVPFDMVYRLYEAAAGDKELYVVPGAGHGMSRRVDPVGYESAVAAFLAKHM